MTEVDEATLRAVHLPPYVAAVEAGARNIMVSLSSWGGLRMHAHRYLLTEVLKGELGFAGFLVSDWEAVDHIHADYYYRRGDVDQRRGGHGHGPLRWTAFHHQPDPGRGEWRCAPGSHRRRRAPHPDCQV